MATKSANAPPPPTRPGAAMPIGNRPDINMGRGQMNMGMDIRQQASEYDGGDRSRRPEMRGPSADTDINSILSGLKTKSINIQQQQQQQQPQQEQQDSMSSSFMFPDDASAFGDDSASVSAPIKSKRKPRSERNTISLNI